MFYYNDLFLLWQLYVKHDIIIIIQSGHNFFFVMCTDLSREIQLFDNPKKYLITGNPRYMNT